MVVGPDVDDRPVGATFRWAFWWRWRGTDEGLRTALERRIHHSLNEAEGLHHVGQRDSIWLRLSRAAAEAGFRPEHLGRIIHARLHADLGETVDRVQVTPFTDEKDVVALQERAQAVYRGTR